MGLANQQCTYAFAQLPSRDEVVFKSIVGLLNGRTCVQWQHILEGAPDVLVLGFSEASREQPISSSKVVLRIYPKDQAQEAMSVHWPLRAAEIFERLEQAAKLVTQSAVPTTARGETCTYKLLGWPSHQLLQNDAGYLRITTLLGARALTLTELSERARVDQQRCAEFIERLAAQGLLHTESTVQEPPAPVAAAPATGFFARLRAHLGLAAGKAD